MVGHTVMAMSRCLGCGRELTQRHQKIYCSNACQMQVKQRRMVEEWLSTGVGKAQSKRRHYIRDYVLDQQGGLCALCAIPSEWNGLELAFVLDHVDGDATNNRRENLRLVCPNCDSQLPTYKAKNRGSGRAWRRQRYADGKSY